MITQNRQRRVVAAIPSWGRVQVLARALESLAQGNTIPDEVWVLHPQDDQATAAMAVRYGAVPVPHHGFGHVPPLMAAADRLRGCSDLDWIFIMDDDARVRPDTLSRLVQCAAESAAAGVGGRVVNYIDGIEIQLEAVTKTGSIGFLGAIHGYFHHPFALPGPVVVRHLVGGVMLWRVELFAGVSWDLRFNRYIARRYEVMLGEEIAKSGRPILYLPEAIVDHYPAPRAAHAKRYELVRLSAATGYVWTLILRRYLSPPRRWLALGWWIGWGDAESPGILRGIILSGIAGRSGWPRMVAGLKGRLSALCQPAYLPDYRPVEKLGDRDRQAEEERQ